VLASNYLFCWAGSSSKLDALERLLSACVALGILEQHRIASADKIICTNSAPISSSDTSSTQHILSEQPPTKNMDHKCTKDTPSFIPLSPAREDVVYHLPAVSKQYLVSASETSLSGNGFQPWYSTQQHISEVNECNKACLLSQSSHVYIRMIGPHQDTQ
jgi:hypothetical protein